MQIEGFIIAIGHDGLARVLKNPSMNKFLQDTQEYLHETIEECLGMTEYKETPGVYQATFYVESWEDNYSGGWETDCGFYIGPCLFDVNRRLGSGQKARRKKTIKRMNKIRQKIALKVAEEFMEAYV